MADKCYYFKVRIRQGELDLKFEFYNTQRMLNPHQNININISYNLGADKAPKTLPAKRINKHHKVHANPDSNCDIEIKLNKKNTENNLRKSNENKASAQSKKNKIKKPSNLTRNTFTPDLYNDCRIKTEGPSADNEFASAFKKDCKSKPHNKSVQQPLHKISQSTKKSTLAKTTKTIKHTHVASCNIPNYRKNQLEFTQHAISQAVSTTFKKRRAQSTFIKNDKVIAKLLNVSILASQLGGSQPITSERKYCESSQSRSFKEYMSSMDMRLIHTMQNDVPVFADKKEHPYQDAVRRIMVSKNISLQQLTRKVIIIQRFFKNKIKEKVIHKYKLIFQQISQKLIKNDKISEISGIAHSPEDQQENSYHNGLSIFENQGVISAVQSSNKRKNSLQSQEQQNSLCNLRWIQENEQSKQLAEDSLGLNLKKYRELVNQEVQKKNVSQKSKNKQKYKQQTEQWKNINKQITNIMSIKGAIDFQIITDQLIKQSTSNQYWIDNDLDNSEQKPSASAEDQSSDQIVFPQHNRNTFSQKAEELPSIPFLPFNLKYKPAKYEDSLDQDEEDNLYDKNKYEQTAQDKRKQDPTSPKQASNEELRQRPKAEIAKIDISRDRINVIPRKNQQLWITQQISQDNVVKNYLDCGLDDFGINVNSRIIQIPRASQQDFQQNQNQHNFSEDQAIGSKFQQANLAIIKKKTHDQPDLQPALLKMRANSLQTDQVVQNVVRFLITEFASDISIILRKATGPQEKKAPPPPRTQGIATNFNAIRDYLQKFIGFIKKQPKNLQKITQTINKDIGPTSLEILTYLRPQPEDSSLPFGLDNDEQSYDDQEGLFVIPAEIFQHFQAELERQYFAENHKQMNQRMKAYISFWHRCIFQSYNECLDYERPFGVQGKPYQWTTQTKMFRWIKRSKVMFHLQRAQNRLLDLTMLVGGIIFQKNDSPFIGADLSEEQKHMMNEERLSRILATELLESQQSWINYNDQLAQLLVELSRMIQEKVFFQYGTELKKLQRRRKMIAQESAVEQSVVFNIQEL